MNKKLVSLKIEVGLNISDRTEDERAQIIQECLSVYSD